MLYPKPHAQLIDDWDALVRSLLENSPADHCVLRAAHPTVLEVLAASPGTAGSLTRGERLQRQGDNYCEILLRTGKNLCVCDADSDAHWDATVERRAGLMAYCGTPLLWPDNEAFGALELLAKKPFSQDEADRCLRLLECLGKGVNAQLDVLFRREQQHFDSTHDRLTGLANGRLFGEQARQQIQIDGENSNQLWLLMWCIDDLDSLRSALPPSEAEALMRAAIERAHGCIRDSDFISRLADNRFALLVTEANEFVATAVADRIRRSTRRIWHSATDDRSLNISCGITGVLPDDTLKSLVDRCNNALQAAQKYGGGQTITLSD